MSESPECEATSVIDSVTVRAIEAFVAASESKAWVACVVNPYTGLPPASVTLLTKCAGMYIPLLAKVA